MKSQFAILIMFLATASACGSSAATDGGAMDATIRDAAVGDAAVGDAGPPSGPTIDEPHDTTQIELVETRTEAGYVAEFYRNRAYTCGASGFHTFAVVYEEALDVSVPRPLWARLHGGGVGAFGDEDRNGDGDNDYVPLSMIGMLDEEGPALAYQILETGLIREVRNHASGFRFLMPSLCDHDLYSGVGVPEPNNPFSPDDNGMTRAADGLLATKAAISFTRDRFSTTHIFLHGTSAGSIGSFSAAYTFERAGLRLSGIVMDSHVLSRAFEEIIAAGCTPYDAALVRAKVGPLADDDNFPDLVVRRGEITVPIMHVWSRGDPTCCGETPITFTDSTGMEQTMGSCDYHHRAFRMALEDVNPGGASQSMRLCVNDPSTATPDACDMHSPTKNAHDEPTPAGDQDLGGDDYNARIMSWVTARLAAPPP